MLNGIVLNRTLYMYKMDLALDNLQWLICLKTKPNQGGKNSYKQWCLGYDTKQNFEMRLHFCISWQCGVPLRCRYTLVYSGRDGSTLLGSHLRFR